MALLQTAFSTSWEEAKGNSAIIDDVKGRHGWAK